MHRLISDKKTVLPLGLALILAAGGLATATSMGFKVKKVYMQVEGRLNTLSLPYLYTWPNEPDTLPQDGATFFNNLNAILPAGRCTRVCTIFPNYPANGCWNGPGGFIFPIGTPANIDFNLDGTIDRNIGRVEDGYLIGIADTDNDGTSDTSERISQSIVGAHRPFALTLTYAEPDVNFKSIPYHSAYTDGAQIFNDIPNCTRVCHIFPNYPANECWNGPSGAVFPIIVGEAYIIGVSRPNRLLKNS